MVPNSLGPAELLLRYGTDAQKNYYLPRPKLGEKIFFDAWIKFKGKSHAVIERHVFREKGNEVALGVGTYNIY